MYWKRTSLAFAIVMVSAAASAVTPLSRAESMAYRSGEVIGAAAGCGVSEDRLIAVGRTTAGLISQVAGNQAEANRARKLHEQIVARQAARMREHQADCPTAIADFEKAERN